VQVEIVDPTGQNDDNSYKALAALGILSAVQSLVKATFSETQVRRTVDFLGWNFVSLIASIKYTTGIQSNLSGVAERYIVKLLLSFVNHYTDAIFATVWVNCRSRPNNPVAIEFTTALLP